MADNITISKLAEAIVSQVVERLSQILLNEALSLNSVKDDVERLRQELDRMCSFLEDADRKQEEDKRVRGWIAEVSNVANEIEDLIEIFISEVSFYNKFFLLHKLRKQINCIQAKLEVIFKSAQTYRIESCRGEGTSSIAELPRSLGRSSLDVEEDDGVLSLEDSVKTLLGELMKEKDELSFVCVVGMGGLGKTTLAKKVYESNVVKQHFDCCAWVLISQRYVSKDVLYEILVQIEKDDSERENLRNLSEDELSKKLSNGLREKKYLVVLDDIWKIEYTRDSIKKAFPEGKQGSKVLYTSLNKEVALFGDPCSSQIQLPLLTFEESWELLQRKVFRRETFGDHGFLPEFKELGKEMVKKCEGLPLAVLILGGLLRTKQSLEEWRKVQKDVNPQMNRLQSHLDYDGRVNGILALSYYDLPYYLKPCFLYLGSFPDDLEIPKKTLIQLWIAEGFVQKPKREEANKTTLEDVAEQYLGELVDRCMIQVSKRNNSGIGVKTLRMHDLTRGFCVSKARDENFFQIIHHGIEMNMSEAASSVHHNAPQIRSRKIFVHGPCGLDRYQVQHPLHSLLCFNINYSHVLSLRRKHVMLLKTLELGGTYLGGRLDGSLKEICTLVHLRYLGLQNTGVSKLPKRIGNLRNLHTLDLRFNNVKLPRGISRLRCLAHLLTNEAIVLKYWGSAEPRFYSVVDYRRSADPKRVKYLLMVRYDSLVQLANLQELKMIFRSKEEATKVLESPITERGQVRSLDMQIVSDIGAETFPSLGTLSECCLLYKLRLSGELERDMSHSSLQSLPTSLVKLTLEDCRIHHDPMKVLERLPNLRLLQLFSDSYRGSKLVCSAGGFPKLETLQLCELYYLKEWEIEKDAMPSLKRLNLEHIPQLMMIPEGLKFVTTLSKLDVSKMSKSFNDKLIRVNEEGVEGEDFYKVCHIPSVIF